MIGISTDSHYSHLAWINTDRKDGGLGGLEYPLAADFTKKIAADYGVLIEEAGIALRGLFIIDPNVRFHSKQLMIWVLKVALIRTQLLTTSSIFRFLCFHIHFNEKVTRKHGKKNHHCP